MKHLEEKDFTVYGLLDRSTSKIFYVGHTSQEHVCKRKANHIEDARKGEESEKAEIIRKNNYEIPVVFLFQGRGILEYRYYKEQIFINLLEPIGNKTGAKPIPPNMAGHNRMELTHDAISLLGKLPDHEIAKRIGISKDCIARRREERGIPSFAEQTGKDGKFKKGEAKGTVKGFYTKVKPEFIKLLGTMPDKKLADLAGVGLNCIFKKRKELKIEPFGKNHGRNKKDI